MYENNTWIWILLAVGLISGLSIWWRYNRSNAVLQEWAARNGYQILEQQYRTLMRGPFFLTSSKSQAVYQITVRDRAGYTRQGWVRVGGWFGGMMSDNIEVRWDDER